MNIRKFVRLRLTNLYANKDHATAVNMAMLSALQTWVLYWQGAPKLVAVAIALTCVCVGLLAGIVAEVFGWQR